MPNSFLERLLPYRERAGELALGIGINKLIENLFSYVLYPWIIYKYGALNGGFVMMFLSLVTSLLTLKFYDWSQRDWLGIEAIKSLKDYRGEHNAGRMTRWFLRKSEPAAFLFLCFWHDPFITTAYLRKGKFNGMTSRDWCIFYGSVLVSNGYWILACYMGITLVEWAWQCLKGIVS